LVRKLPEKCPEAPANAFEASGNWKRHTYEISLITPLFGGGPVPGENDPVTLIRGASIRGNLRFWWRATRGARFENIKDLRAREGEIWGTASYPSLVTVNINEVTKGRPEQWATYKPDRKRGGVKSLPGPVNEYFKMYALFPFRGETKKIRGERKVIQQPSSVIRQASFKLILKWPKNMDLLMDIKAAVWAWVNFGGLGARTRRGCGALYCSELSPSSDNVDLLKNWYKRCLEKYSIEPPLKTRNWPTLPEPNKILIQTNNGGEMIKRSPLKAWAKTIEALEKFRQKPGIGRRRKSDGKPGRSLWPEADSLRQLTGQSSPKHRHPTTTRNNAFPRAEFGLPIVFHFKDSHDPVDCKLLPPCDLKRMASPLILKPLAVNPDQAVSMILPLRTNLPGGVTVKYTNTNSNETNRHFGHDNVRSSHLAEYDSPLKFASSSGSALDAFLKYARSREGFR